MELEQFLQAIDTARVRHVRFVVGDTELSTSDRLMVVCILAAMDANEYATKSRLVKRELEQNAAAGLPHGGNRSPFAAAVTARMRTCLLRLDRADAPTGFRCTVPR